jgi:hypothetical protein
MHTFTVPECMALLQMVKIRSAQTGTGCEERLLPTSSFSASQLEMLRHAFELLCTEGGQQAGICREQLAEIVVMAGLELSIPDTKSIVREMVCLA